MIRISRHAQATFWADALKGALVTAIPCLAFDWMLLSHLGALFLFMIVFAPLVLFAAAAFVMFLFRRPGWLAGPAFILLVNGAFLEIVR